MSSKASLGVVPFSEKESFEATSYPSSGLPRRTELGSIEELGRLQHRANDQCGAVVEARAVKLLPDREDLLVSALFVRGEWAAEGASAERAYEPC